MKPQSSPLNIIEFGIINFEFNFIQPEKNDSEELRKYFSEYELDIDFAIHGNDVLQVLIKAEVNKERKLSGYRIIAEAACFFEFDKTLKISEEAKNNIGGFSTVYIGLNLLRGFISQMTGNAPLGRYILPSIDLNDLIEQKKNKLINKAKSKKQRVKK